MRFIPTTTDFVLSPYTGLNRQSWTQAGEYLLEGVFQHVKALDDPIVVPRQDTKITYPHVNASEEVQIRERKAEMFEGLTRTFFVAAPLIHDNPELKICGFSLREYYKKQVLRSCTKTDSIYVGDYEMLQKIAGYANPFQPYQQTVETCALVICLWMTKEEIWDTYTQEEKDTIAAVLSSFAHGNTHSHNWRLFNMLDMAFLHMMGYPIQEDMMRDHAQAVLNYYVGDGWYRDGHSFDYYSCWGFNLYAPIWNLWYGYEHEPYIAKKFEEHSNKLMATYCDFFDRDGFTNMWGRSSIYRNAATSAFAGNMFLRNSKLDAGRARRIASGSLMQFLGREDFWYKGVPTLGFYRQFMPLVQSYSCANSPFWLGKAFLCLYFPKEHPFWSDKEHNGTWENLSEQEVKVTTLNGPALCFSNHQANGETILRTGKVNVNINDPSRMSSYARLCFNTKYPWEATPNGAGLDEEVLCKGVEAQQYSLLDGTTGNLFRANAILWHGVKEGVLYRKQFFDYTADKTMGNMQAMNLADVTVPYGILRVDKMCISRRPVKFTLGSYGFPDNGTEIIEKSCGSARAIIFKGRNFIGREKQMAMTIYDGWDEIGYVHSSGTNADSEKSLVIYASAEKKKQYGGNESYVMISQVITKESLEDFTEEELFPIASVEYADDTACGCFGAIKIILKNSEVKNIDFDGIEGKLMA